MRKRQSQILKCVAISFSFLLMTAFSRTSEAAGQEIITSATYGVLVGTIVGAATLAFTDDPGDNLNRIARGASLGLYAGILLGAYVSFGISDEPEYYDDEVRLRRSIKVSPPRLAVYPTVGPRGIDGAAASWHVLSF